MPEECDAWREIARTFSLKLNYPFFLGALDGKHVATQKPSETGSAYLNYEEFFIVVLLALVDTDCRFKYVYV